MTSSELDFIFDKYESDKGNICHRYGRAYEMFFTSLRNKKINFLEIGVLRGSSLKAWREYFPSARICGLDINPDAAIPFKNRNDISVYIGSQVDNNILKRIVADTQEGLDIVIDDGSHMVHHLIETFEILFPLMKPFGICVMEDLRCTYPGHTRELMIQNWPGMTLNPDLKDNDRNAMNDFFMRKVAKLDSLDSDNLIGSITFLHNLCFFTRNERL